MPVTGFRDSLLESSLRDNCKTQFPKRSVLGLKPRSTHFLFAQSKDKVREASCENPLTIKKVNINGSNFLSIVKAEIKSS